MQSLYFFNCSKLEILMSCRFRYLALVCLLTTLSSKSFATWSIIIVDPKSKEIGMVGASCTYNVYGIGGIVPGKGAIIVQAMSNKSAKRTGMEMIAKGARPKAILEAILDPFYDPNRQQYAIVCLNELNRPVTFTGNSTKLYNGALKAYGISVQGNTLSSKNELKVILDVILQAQRKSLPLNEILMRALEAGSNAGGDKRCGKQRATSAFITIMKPTDRPDRPFLDLRIIGIDEGSANAVNLLREKHDRRFLNNKN